MSVFTERLEALKEPEYADFMRRLMPTVPPEKVLGIRTLALRRMAKQASMEEKQAFIATLPHDVFEENQLHSFILSDMKEFDGCLQKVERFLPYVDNWATCDQLSPKCFKNHKP